MLDASDGAIDACLQKWVAITASATRLIAVVSWARNALEVRTGARLLPT